MGLISQNTLKVLDTPRLLLRPMTEGDTQTVVNWRNSEHVASMSMKGTNAILTADEHLSWFSKSRGERFDYIIEIKGANIPIGSISLTRCNYPGQKDCWELGKYIGDKSALGKGYATEAALRWVKYAFEDIKIAFIIARTRHDNIANI
ncbi:MAG: GNAT family N-acetyltransferase, partial [Betaproteobacteria bacterium]